jgi:hypothetical protein
MNQLLPFCHYTLPLTVKETRRMAHTASPPLSWPSGIALSGGYEKKRPDKRDLHRLTRTFIVFYNRAL